MVEPFGKHVQPSVERRRIGSFLFFCRRRELSEPFIELHDSPRKLPPLISQPKDLSFRVWPVKVAGFFCQLSH